jgi:hypothetical protein
VTKHFDAGVTRTLLLPPSRNAIAVALLFMLPLLSSFVSVCLMAISARNGSFAMFLILVS